MKKIHIILLVLIAISIGVLVSFLKTTSTYETIAQAKETPGKFVNVAVMLDKSAPIEFDGMKDPNYFSFQAFDSSGQKMKVVYRKGNRDDIKIAPGLVLKGRYKDDHFECVDIQTKCPSKYKDNMKAAEKNIQQEVQTTSPENNSAEKKY